MSGTRIFRYKGCKIKKSGGLLTYNAKVVVGDENRPQRK